jgi:hypothetical protein
MHPLPAATSGQRIAMPLVGLGLLVTLLAFAAFASRDERHEVRTTSPTVSGDRSSRSPPSLMHVAENMPEELEPVPTDTASTAFTPVPPLAVSNPASAGPPKLRRR